MTTRPVHILRFAATSSPPPVETNPPFLANQVPAPAAVAINIGSTIAFRITDAADDANSGVDISSLNVRVQFGAGPLIPVYNGMSGGAQPGYGVTVTDVFGDQLSYDIVITPAALLPGSTLITVYVDVDDLQTLVTNHLGTNYSFTTSPAETNPPFLQNQVPAPAATLVLPTSSIAFRVTDAADDPDSGVDTSTLNVLVQNGVGQPFVAAITAGVFQAGFTGTITDVFANGLSFDVVINPGTPLAQVNTIAVRVQADDTKTIPNSLDTTYTFTTTASDVVPPFLSSSTPAAGATGVDGSAPLVLFINDADSGVAVGTINVVATLAGVPENVVTGGIIQAGWSGSITSSGGGYVVAVSRTTPIPNSTAVSLAIDASDQAFVPNAMTTVNLAFSTSFPTPTARLAQREFHALIGSIIQVDGRDSQDPDGLPLTFNWSFTTVPNNSVLVADLNVVNPASIVQIFEGRRAVSFIPDVLGTYVISLTVTNGGNTSTQTATVTVGLSLVPCGEGTVPDLSFLWQFMSSFWSLVYDRGVFEALWSAMTQVLSSDYVRAETHNLSAHLGTVQATARLGWQKFSLRTRLLDQPQTIVFGNELAGTGADTGALIPTADQTTRILRVPLGTNGVAGAGDFTAADVDFGIGGRVVEINGAGYTVDRAYNQSGALSALDSVFLFDGLAYTDITAEARSSTLTASPWPASGGQLLVGSQTPFDVLRFAFETPANVNLGFTFERSNGAGGWVAFTPTSDGTTGATASGDVTLNESALLTAGWGPQAVDGVTRYWVRVTRATAVVTTPPVLTTLLEVESYSFLVVRASEIPNNQRDVPFRLGHHLHVPLVDLEAAGVAAGDVLVLEVLRKDTGQSAELRAQVTAVDGQRLSFELTLGSLTDGSVPVPDRALFQQLVQDLRMVAQTAADADIAAMAEAFIHYVPTGINLSRRPWSEYQFQIRAKAIMHNSGVAVDTEYVSIPALQYEIKNNPERVYLENQDFALSGGFLLFTSGLFSTTSPSPEELWAECAHIDNSEAIERNFGGLVGLRRSDLVRKATRAPYLAAVKGLWFAVTDHPSVKNVRLAMQILMGLPFTVADGIIIAVTPAFTTDSSGNSIGRLLVEDLDAEGTPNGNRRFYFYPDAVGLDTNPDTGAPYAVNDRVAAFVPLSQGVDVQDWISDPDWWQRELLGQEVRKYHTFRAQLDTATGVFNTNDLVFTLGFLRSIKPVYSDLLAAVLQSLSDPALLANFTETIAGSALVSRFYENAGPFGRLESTVRADHLNNQGAMTWLSNSRPFRTVTPAQLNDVVTQIVGSSVEANSVTGFGTGARFRIAGNATNPPIEGDILVILEGQPGAGSVNGYYELIGGSLPNGPVTLGNVAPLAEPVDWTLTPPLASTFNTGSSLRACVVRREMNPITRGADLQTTAGALQLGDSVSAGFLDNAVAIDDHLVIETGANQGEYRIVSIVAQTSPRDLSQGGLPQISNTQVGLVALDGTNPALTDLTGQVFRVIRPQLVRNFVTGCRILQSGGDMFASKVDFANAGEPFDVFTPGMVGQTLTVARADNPANNGTYTILEYIHAGRVRITTGSAVASDVAATAEIRISSQYHWGFERAEDLGPSEVFSAVVS